MICAGAIALSGCEKPTAQAPSALPEASDAENTTPSRSPEVRKPVETPKVPAEKEAAFIDHAVPFTSQAPTGGWDDQRQQDGCEEAAAYMAYLWTQKKGMPGSKQALADMLAISDYEQETYGEYRDVSLEDIRDWIFKDYFKYSNIEVKQGIKAADIIEALESGAVVLAPMNGQKLGNPNFSGAGPERHMILIRGYDPAKKQFIANDPGTRRGERYRYSESTIMSALLAYPTGYHVPADENKKGILIVRK